MNDNCKSGQPAGVNCLIKKLEKRFSSAGKLTKQTRVVTLSLTEDLAINGLPDIRNTSIFLVSRKCDINVIIDVQDA